MKLMRLALPPIFALVLALPAAAQAISLDALSAYLNSLKSVATDFTQINADGSRSTGKLYIARPGRARFEYAPPDQTLVLASGGQVAIFDDKSNTLAEQYPLRSTPLNLVLAANIDLGAARMVVGHGSDANVTWVEAQDPEHPEYGSITLLFTPAPTTLRQWIIRDQGGNQTAVLLGDLMPREDLSAFLFSITAEVNARKD